MEDGVLPDSSDEEPVCVLRSSDAPSEPPSVLGGSAERSLTPL